MSFHRTLALVIHDLNPWGGHDRSTLEIARRLSHRLPLELYSFTLNDPTHLHDWNHFEFRRIFPDPKWPEAARMLYFHLITPFLLGWKRRSHLIHATGTCSLMSDIVQVQFVNMAWSRVKKSLPGHIDLDSESIVVRMYRKLMLQYGILSEAIAYTRRKTYIAISDGVAEELKENFGITRNVHIIRHGVDPIQFSPATRTKADERIQLRAKLGLSPQEKAIVFVGAYERKGLSTAIQSLAHLRPQVLKNTRLIAVGSGSVAKFGNLAKSLGVSDHVMLLPHQREIAAYYRASDLFLLPTYYEPFGLVVLEAMASGIPPVVSRCAGASELIQPNRSGCLIDNPFDPKEVASLLEPLLEDRVIRETMGSEARAVAEQRSWDRVAEEYYQLLKLHLQ